MGCVFGKASSVVKDKEESPKHRELRRKSSELRPISSNRKESFLHRDKLENGEVRIGLVDKKSNVSRRVRDGCYEKKTEITEIVSNFPVMGRVPKALEGEQVAAGWPNWLVNVAGEAIKGWIPRKADSFERLDKIGQGTYSSVYKGRDIVNNKVVALKKVRFDNMDPESVKFMAREILILRRLDHPNVIKLEALVTSRTSSSLYLVFEYMEHDLTGLGALPEVKFTEPQVKCYMQQLLSGLDHCHNRGVLHRDIKGSNLLIDNHGILKIADFGLASYFDINQNVPLTSRVVTLWYRPPELLLGATNYGVAVDLWSTGCILGELYTGKPIMPGRTEVEQLHQIFKLCGSPSEEYWMNTRLPHSTVFKPRKPYRKRIAETFRNVPDAAVELMETLLSVDPAYRGTADSALKSKFFRTEPLPCDPSSLPKYPPSKEIDAKLREEELRRHRVSGVRGEKIESDLKGSNELRAAAAPHANAELAMSMQQRRQGQSNPKSRSEYFSSQNGEPCSDFLVNPPSSSQGVKDASKDRHQILPERIITHSGPLSGRRTDASKDRHQNIPERIITHSGLLSGRKTDDASNFSTKNDLSQYSGLVTSKAFPSSQDKIVPSQVHAANQFCRLSESFGDPRRNRDERHHSQVFRASQQLENGRATSTKEYAMDGHVNKEKKIHFSGPLVAPSTNIEQILREHDRRIQEVGRRQRRDKAMGRPQEQHPTQRFG